MMPARPCFHHCAATIFGRVFFLPLCSTPVHAQQRYLLEETTAANGKAAIFEAAQKDYCAAVLRGGAPQCLVFSPTTFSPGDLFFTLLRFSSFRHYDEGTYTSKDPTPEQVAELESRRGPMRVQHPHRAFRTQDECRPWDSLNPQPALAGASRPRCLPPSPLSRYLQRSLQGAILREYGASHSLDKVGFEGDRGDAAGFLYVTVTAPYDWHVILVQRFRA